MTILYCGDTHLQDAAAYLAGLLSRWNWDFDYLPSDESPDDGFLNSRRELYVFSDYPAENLAAELQQRIVDDVAGGAGLIMFGGWESFHGAGGNWDGTPVGEILPVEIRATDDRVNCDHPVLLASVADHPAVDGLPWNERPPLIGGFNRVQPKTNVVTVLEARHFSVQRDGDAFRFTPAGSDPLLVFGTHGAGKVAACLTDVAPHWVGPLVDWGEERVAAQAEGANDVEVGGLYAEFLRKLLTFLRRS